MKQLTTYLNEDFKISKDTKIIKEFPKNIGELFTIISNRYDESPKHLDLTDIDVSNIDTFYYNSLRDEYIGLFQDCRSTITIDITGWNTSRVTSMEKMFLRCYDLTEIKGLENIDVSSVKNFNQMFFDCKSLHFNNLENWKVKESAEMNNMFGGCKPDYIKIPTWYVAVRMK